MYSNSHTYTHNVVDGVEAASPVHSINSHKNYHLSASSNKSGSTSTCSTLSLDGSTLQQSISISPIHSPQSGYVVNYSVAGGAALGFNGDNLISTTTNTPPPPPPPPPLPLPTNNNNNSNYNNTIFNENKENKQNTYNRTPLVKNAYNQLLKEYSNKMQTQCNYNGNGYHYNNKNMTPKPFRAQSHLQLQSQSVGNPSNFDNLNNLSNSSQAIVPSPSASVVNTLNSVENNQSIDLQKSATVASSMPYSIGSNVSDEQTNSNNSINVNNNDYDNGSGSGTDRAQDQPFRYVTLTGNVIRSVMPPGKGTNINYKVNQGYARPFGAPASAPKSPVSFPPQPQQQWGASQPAAARPATGNSYATLPRSSIGQSQDELVPKDESQTPSRCFTPCSFTNKPAPIVPFYQTAEKLCFDECPAQHARDYDRRSASPFPDRARSPAPGPPPNPLAAIRAPRVKENELSPRMLQAGSITTGQSYLGAQQQHYESTTQAGYQSFLQKPETVQTSQVGDTRVEQRQSESQLAEQQKSQTQSKTTTQIGNTQIERRRRVTEEFEHSQTAKTIEIRTETDRRQSYGKTGFVANVARRLSGMEQEINSLSSQSQSISERAAHLSSGTVFPQLKSPEPPEKFPTKPVLPPHDEPQPQSYILSATANNNNKMIGPPPGFQQQQQRNSLSACYGTSLATAIRQQQQQQQQQQKSLSAYESTTSSIQSSLSNAVSSSLTMASASTTNQASVSSGVCPVTGTFCRPGHTCCKQQVMQTARADARSMSVSSAISNQYRPTASTGAVGFKPPQPQPQPQQQPQSQAFAAAPPQAPNVVARASIDIDPTNDVGSAGGAGGKGGAFGATSAPKRGRGIMNKAVAPGVRVPLCNSCQTQIRGPFITALGRIWCPEHFICVNANCRRPLQDIGFVEEKGDLYCEYCFEKYLAPSCSKCNSKIKGDCLNAIGRHFHPECFTCAHCGKIFGNTPFFLEDGNPYCEADWNELFTTKCFACGFPVEAGDRWVEALNHNYHSQCFNCTYCKQNLEGQSFYNKGGRPFCKNHAR